jgi:adenosylhomocysteine nucleosidase
MTRTAFIAALPSELRPLVRGWQHESRDGVDCWLHRDENLWVAACAGAGQEAATRAFAAVERDAPVDLVFSVGYAGALREDLKAGTAHNAAGVIDVRTGERFRCDAEAGELWLATSPRVADPAEKRRLAQTYGAALVDMEAAAIGRLAGMREIPFYCVKGISDGFNDNLPDFNPYISADGHFAIFRFCLSMLFQPWHWPPLVRMGENSKSASLSIARSLRDFLDE